MDNETIKQAIQSVRDFYKQQGIFMKQFGYGISPALLIIDMAYGWTDPEYATGSQRLDEAIVELHSIGKGVGFGFRISGYGESQVGVPICAALCGVDTECINDTRYYDLRRPFPRAPPGGKAG